MTIKDIQTHVEDASERLPNQFVSSTNLVNLVEVNANRFQGINDELIKIRDGVSVSTSSGKQLDNIATYLDLIRESGESDTDFRARLLAQSAVLVKSGEVPHVIDVYILLTGADSANYIEMLPAGFQLTAHIAVDAEDADADSATLSAMQDVRAGGVEMILLVSTETDFFNLDSSDFVDGSGNGEISASSGLGSSTASEGGQIARLLA